MLYVKNSVCIMSFMSISLCMSMFVKKPGIFGKRIQEQRSQHVMVNTVWSKQDWLLSIEWSVNLRSVQSDQHVHKTVNTEWSMHMMVNTGWSLS